MIGEPPAPVLVYSGRCLFDESVQSIRREMGGEVDVDGKATLRLPSTEALFDQDTDMVQVTANGRVFVGARVVKVSYLRRRTVLVLDLKHRPTLA